MKNFTNLLGTALAWLVFSMAAFGQTNPCSITQPVLVNSTTGTVANISFNPTLPAAITNYTVARTPTGSIVTKNSNPNTGFTDSGVQVGNSYTYTVTVTAVTGCTTGNTIVNATSAPLVVTIANPCASFPGNIVLTQGALSQNSVVINVSGVTATTYTVTRSTNGGAFSTITPNPKTTTSFTDATLTPGNTYNYVVTFSPVTNCNKTSNNLPVGAPAFPAPVLNASSNSQTQVNLSWNLVSPTPSEIQLYRSTSPNVPVSSANLVTILSGGLTSFTDASLSPGTRYYYKVRALFGSGGSLGNSVSNEANAITTTFPSPTLTASTNSPILNSLNWTFPAGSPTPSEIKVYRGTAPNVPTGSANLVATINGGLTSYLDNATPNVRYYYKVQALFGAAGASGSSQSNEVNVLTLPLSPATNLSVRTVNCSTLGLSWTDAVFFPLLNEEGYEIYRAAGNTTAGATLIATVGQNVTSYEDRELAPNAQFTYYVVAKYGVGRASASNVASGTTSPYTISMGEVTASAATVNWTNCSPFIQSYRVYLSENGGVFNIVADFLPQMPPSYRFNNLKQNTNYQSYIVTLFNGIGGPSNVVSFTTPKFPAPTELKAEPVTTTSIKLTWKDNSNGPNFEESFLLYRSKDGGKNFEAPISIPQNTTTYTDNNVKVNESICYFIAARFGTGISEPSNVACETPCPPAITKFSKVEAFSTSQINLFWEVPAELKGTNAKIQLEVSADGNTFTKLNELPSDAEGFFDINLQPNQKRFYRIFVSNDGSCKSAFSEIVSARSCPPAPTNIVASPLTSSTLEVSWDALADVKSYEIQRSEDNIDFTKVGTVAGDITKFTDSGLKSSTRYYYRVLATNESNCASVPSTVRRESTAITCPAPPSNLKAVAENAGRIVLTFTDNAPDETGFTVETSLDEKTWGKVEPTLAPNTTSMTITEGVQAETKYFFRIRSLGATCSSDYSTVVSVNTPPPAPTTLVARGVKINQVDLSWTNTSKTANGIEIQRAKGNDSNYTSLTPNAAATATSLQNAGLEPNTSYKYRIRYTSANGNSDWSNIADATTLVITANEDGSLNKQVAMFPVPATNVVYIKTMTSIVGKVATRIMNNTGTVLINKDFNGLAEGKTEEINVSKLITGMYFLEVQTAKGKVVKKFMKQ